MKWFLWGVVLSLFGSLPQWGSAEVIINEFSAASSDRVLRRIPGKYPSVGATVSWQEADYDDSRWRSGSGPFAYWSAGDVPGFTDLSGLMYGRATSVYLRKSFVVSALDATSEASLQLTIRYRHGFIAFLNGIEVARRSMGPPGMFAFRDQTAFNFNTNNQAETIVLGVSSNLLVAGENIFCIQAHALSITGDVLVDADLQIADGPMLIPSDSEWRYFPGFAEPSGGVLDYGAIYGHAIEGGGVRWATRTFDDSTWPTANGPIGIDGDEPPDYDLGTNLFAQVFETTPSIYTRRVFSVTPEEAASSDPLRLTLDYDDGVIVYLNGREVARGNIDSTGFAPPWNWFADTEHDANGDNGGTVIGQEEVVYLPAAKDWLFSGENILAVQLHRASLSSRDAVARITLETTGPAGRTLCLPEDEVRYYFGAAEPGSDIEPEDTGAIAEAPDSESDWIELYNSGPTSVSLAGWSLTDNANNPRKWMFPNDAIIGPGEYILVLADGLDIGPDRGATYLHANFKLDANGEYLGLVDADGVVRSQFSPTYPVQNYFHSFGRDTNGQFGYLSPATPGRANEGISLPTVLPPPQFSAEGGFHDDPFSLTLFTPTIGASVYYTTDGSEPNPGTLYTAPINILTNTIIRARAVASNAVPSPVVTHTYLIGQSAGRKSLPALCLGGDPALIFYGPNAVGGPTNGEGIFAIKGGVYVDNDLWHYAGDMQAYNIAKKVGRAMEKPASLEFFPLSGEPLRTEFGLRLSGSAYSRDRFQLTNAMNVPFTISFRQKPSFNFFFRSEWGERPIEYPFFPDGSVTRFESIRLRAGKNDILNPFLRDELIRRIYRDTGQKSSVGIFNTLYINGVYKGYFNLCERLREGFMQEHHQSTEAWDVQQVNVFSDGDPIHWNKMISYMRSAQFTNLNEYLGMLEYLDVDNFIDYLAVNAYVAMWDWPNNNWVAARERSPQGRWRFYMWDAEGGLGYNDLPITHDTFVSELIIGNPRTTTSSYIPALYTLLRESPEFRLRFADRVQKHCFNGGALVKSNMQAHFLTLRDTLNPIMLDHFGGTVSEGFYQTWIVSDVRRTNFFNQLVAQGLWPAVAAPELSHPGGIVTNGLQLSLSNPNASGTIYFTTNGTDPRLPGGAINGSLYSVPLLLNDSTVVKARVLDEDGVWSPLIEGHFVVPSPIAVFLPTGSADWNVSANWSTSPKPHPDGAGQSVLIPPPTGAADRNVNLRSPVTIGEIHFPQGNSSGRNRVRDQNTGNTLTLAHTNGPARIEVGGTGPGYVEFEVTAGSIVVSDLQLHVTNIMGHPDYGALRLRANWSGPGGLIKSGVGTVSLTGDAKTYTGPTIIEEGVLQLTEPATPTASSQIIVQPGGQLRLTSGSEPGVVRVYNFGGDLTLNGHGRGASIPDDSGMGKRGALRYAPGNGSNHAMVQNNITLSGASEIHVNGAGSTLTLTGPLSGSHSLTKSGAGVLQLNGENSSFSGLIQIDNGTLAISNSWNSPINISAGGTLTGAGEVGAIGGAGSIHLQQILHAAAISGLTQHFTFTKSGSPDYTQPFQAGNGTLILPSAPVSPAAVNIYLPTVPAPDSRYRGAYFVPFSADLTPLLANEIIHVYAPDAGGTHLFNNQRWSPVNAQVTTVAELAELSSGAMQGRTLEVRGGGFPTSFSAWQFWAFPDSADRANPLIAGPSADPLNSGMPNLLRYAFGLTLTDSSTNQTLEFVSTVETPTLRFPFDSGRADIACLVEATSDLSDWSSATILFDSRTDFPPPAIDGRIEVTDPTPATTQRFYRLRVVQISDTPNP